MGEFLKKTLEPDVFWTALAALATLLAVLVALFMPLFSQYVRNNRLERLIKAEMDHNLKVIRNFVSKDPLELPDGKTVSPITRNNELVRHIDLRLWREYRYELAGDRPHSFEKFNSINRYAEAIIDAQGQPDPMQIVVQSDEAKSYVEHHEKTFKA